MLTLTGAGADIQSGKIVFDYGPSGSDPATAIHGAMISGLIHSSTADVNHELGWADRTSSGNVTVMYTVPGDANLDGTVDNTDLTIVATNYYQTGMTWQYGDFNGDGTVDLADWAIMITHYGEVLSPLAPQAAVISLLGADPTDAGTVQFVVAFSEAVTGVDAGDFALAATGSVSGASIVSVVGCGKGAYKASISSPSAASRGLARSG